MWMVVSAGMFAVYMALITLCPLPLDLVSNFNKFDRTTHKSCRLIYVYISTVVLTLKMINILIVPIFGSL